MKLLVLFSCVLLQTVLGAETLVAPFTFGGTTPGGASKVALSPNGKFFIIEGHSTCEVIRVNIATKTQDTLSESGNGCWSQSTISPDNSFVLYIKEQSFHGENHFFTKFDLSTKKSTVLYNWKTEVKMRIESLDFSPDGTYALVLVKFIQTGSTPPEKTWVVYRYDMGTNKLTEINQKWVGGPDVWPNNRAFVHEIKISPNGKFAVIVDQASNVFKLDLTTKEASKIATIPKLDWITDVSFGSSNDYVITSNHGLPPIKVSMDGSISLPLNASITNPSDFAGVMKDGSIYNVQGENDRSKEKIYKIDCPNMECFPPRPPTPGSPTVGTGTVTENGAVNSAGSLTAAVLMVMTGLFAV